MTLLKTKLQAPRLTRALVPRATLVSTLNDNLHRDLTLISAPAGYGKTTLVSEWALQSPVPVAWLSLDEADNDMSVFLDYFIGAIRTLFPDACATTSSLARGTGNTPNDILAMILVSEIDDLPRRFALILDDYHVISRPEIHTILEQLLTRPPLQMHLIITTRSDPPYSLARLRAGGMLTELRVQDLRFPNHEARQILTKTTGITDPQMLDALADRSEGWIAGLHLVALTMRGTQLSPEMLNTLIAKDDRFVLDYLFEQVLKRLTPEVRAFALKTAIPNRVCDALAEAITGSDDAAASLKLASLEGAGLFLTRLDNAGEWFVYHGLFRSILLQALVADHRPNEIAELHRRTAIWFSSQALVDDAIHHALEAGDFDLAASVTITGIESQFNRDDMHDVIRWLNRLPPALVEANPGLLISKAHALFFQLEWEAANSTIHQAEMRLEEYADLISPQELARAKGAISYLWASYWLQRCQPEQLTELINRTMVEEPKDTQDFPDSAILLVPVALQWLGRFDEAERWLNQLLAVSPNKPFRPLKATRILFAQAALYLAEGYLDRARQLGDMLLATAINSKASGMEAWARLVLGAAALYRNDLVVAAEQFEAGVALRYAGSVVTAQECLSGLALTYQHLGRRNEALGVMSIMSDYHRELINPQLNAAYRALRTRLALMEGDTAQAIGWSGSDRSEIGLTIGWFVIPAITSIQVDMTTGSWEDLLQSAQQLDHLLAEVRRIRQPTRQVELLSLRAVVADRLGETAVAMDALREALTIGEPRGLIRPIADAGAGIEPLLNAAAAANPSSVTYIKRLLAALRPVNAADTTERPRLTPREKEVLALLGDYQTDRVIAETLVVSTLTVRTHIENLGEKLGVRGRRSIVSRARELGLLT